MVKQHQNYVAPEVLMLQLTSHRKIMAGSNYPDSSVEWYNIDDKDIFIFGE